jgi:hypothetical protein
MVEHMMSVSSYREIQKQRDCESYSTIDASHCSLSESWSDRSANGTNAELDDHMSQMRYGQILGTCPNHWRDSFKTGPKRDDFQEIHGDSKLQERNAPL